MTFPQHNNSAPVVEVKTVAPKIYLIGDLAKQATCSCSWVRNVSDEMRIETLRLTNGARVFNEAQAAAVVGEIQRRRMEALK